MFCPRAMFSLFGVGFCAVITGCAVAPGTELASADQKEVATPLIHADSIANTTATPANHAVTREQIIEWSLRGFSDDMIIDHIDHSSNCFHVSASEEIHLHDAGVSDEVIRAMKATAG